LEEGERRRRSWTGGWKRTRMRIEKAVEVAAAERAVVVVEKRGRNFPRCPQSL
jgi:hypothetical protein